MSPEETLRAFIERTWNARDLASFAEHVAPEVRMHPARGAPKGYDDYLAATKGFQAAFSDLRFAIERVVAQGELVAMQLLITGVNDGPFRGRPPTGRSVRVIGRPWARVRDGKIVEFWQSFDELGMLGQLGHAPAELL